MTRRQAEILDSFYRESAYIKAPLQPYNEEDYTDYFAKKRAYEAVFEYVSDHVDDDDDPVEAIKNLIVDLSDTIANLHKISLFSIFIKEQRDLAKRVLQALLD